MKSAPRDPSHNTVLFLDVVGSTRLYEQIGDRTAFSLVTRCLGRASEVVLNRGGRVVKYTGDGLMAVLPTADAAADAAIGIHATMSDCPSVADKGLSVRIGFHSGTIIRSGTDVFGETVNLTARLASIASPGRALTTSSSATEMSAGWRGLLSPVPPRILRGATRPIELYELRCDSSDETTSVFGVPTETQEHELRIGCNGRWTQINDWRPLVRLGRDPEAGLFIEDQRASRLHAEIELRGDKFVLRDHSSNGTYVTIGDTPEFILSREEVVLHGSGWIALGRSRERNPLAIEYIVA
jgi:adenylate cyclase